MTKSISVISVTKNNNIGLIKTLRSISKQPSKPLEIIVFNGDPSDFKISKIINIFKKKLNIILMSGRDDGIYDAMNKARVRANGNLLHYLNAGDMVCDNPYQHINEPCLIKTKVVDLNTGASWFDKPKLFGYAYCHQGIIFPRNHINYDLNFKFCADFDLITKIFPYGLKKIKTEGRGFVIYNLDGVSSKNSFKVTVEMIKIVCRNFSLLIAIFMIFVMVTKTFIPRKLRRLIISKTS